jgi:lysyl-tRNA synthetase class 2
MLKSARAFFAERNILEVDCPALSPAAPVDKHIDVMKVECAPGQEGYLHTSPEYGMKRLLSLGMGDIYQISHVFRKGEIGPWHNPEFTMAEWYRCGFSFEEMIQETLDFIHLFLGDLPAHHLSYKEAFLRYLSIDYTAQTTDELRSLAQDRGIALSTEAAQADKDALLQLLLSLCIEPHLGKEELFVLYHYPPTQAALAKTLSLAYDEEVACRFEVYFKGIELANGYQELTDPIEQERRFAEANAARLLAGKELLKVDERFIQALKAGLPECCGVAVGFDRLMVLRQGHTSLENAIPFTWQDA